MDENRNNYTYRNILNLNATALYLTSKKKENRTTDERKPILVLLNERKEGIKGRKQTELKCFTPTVEVFRTYTHEKSTIFELWRP